MNQIDKVIAGVGATAALVALVSVSSGRAQQPSPCADRRGQAIGLARQINTAQIRQSQAKKAFLPLSELSGIVTPNGFTVQLVHSAAEFVFSIKDTQPECGLAVFSDQNYLIYTGQPLQ